MNLGQLLGAQQLRIYELEELLEQKHGRTNTSEGAIGTQAEGVGASDAAPTTEAPDPRPTVPPPSRRTKTPVWGAIHCALSEAGRSMSVAELASVIPDVPLEKIANNCYVLANAGKLVRDGAGRPARYLLGSRS